MQFMHQFGKWLNKQRKKSLAENEAGACSDICKVRRQERDDLNCWRRVNIAGGRDDPNPWQAPANRLPLWRGSQYLLRAD